MAKRARTKDDHLTELRTLAASYPEAEEGVACKGTALECSAFKVRKKTFLFASARELKVKLGNSLAEAQKLARSEPARFQVGASGWVTVKVDVDQPLPAEILKRWINESYRLLAPRGLVAQLPDS